MKLTRIAAVPAAAAVLALSVAGPASAHVTATPTETAPGAYTVVTFSVGHGCEGSPTTELAIQLPAGVDAATPSRNPYYDVATKGDQVVYTARTPLPDGERDTFELSLQISEDASGQLVFPTIQTCEQGETAWTEVAEEGAEEPEHPAPAFVVGSAEAPEAPDATAVEPSRTKDEQGNGLALAGLVAGVLGLVLGAIALVRTRRA